MAEKRMLSKTFLNSASFMKMSDSAKLLYVYLNLNADDDGIVEVFPFTQMLHTPEDDVKILASKGFIYLMNEDWLSFLPHWLNNQLLRNDRYTPSIYRNKLLNLNPLFINNIKSVSLEKIKDSHQTEELRSDLIELWYPSGIPDGYHLDTQSSVVENSVVENSEGKISKDKSSKEVNLDLNKIEELYYETILYDSRYLEDDLKILESYYKKLSLEIIALVFKITKDNKKNSGFAYCNRILQDYMNKSILTLSDLKNSSENANYKSVKNIYNHYYAEKCAKYDITIDEFLKIKKWGLAEKILLEELIKKEGA